MKYFGMGYLISNTPFIFDVKWIQEFLREVLSVTGWGFGRGRCHGQQTIWYQCWSCIVIQTSPCRNYSSGFFPVHDRSNFKNFASRPPWWRFAVPESFLYDVLLLSKNTYAATSVANITISSVNSSVWWLFIDLAWLKHTLVISLYRLLFS